MMLFLVMDQGDIGDCMYVIYSGQVGVYIFKATQQDSNHHAKAILSANAVVGETAVIDKHTENRRPATLVAHS